jgi:Protein of unknown function (DUF2630)
MPKLDGSNVCRMTAFPGPEIRRPVGPEDIAPEPAGVDLYAHVEGLCAEEDRLLEVAEAERTEEHHARLRAIEAELDRAWAHLRDRAHRRGKPA